MNDEIRFKRRNGRVWSWPTKLFIPVPLITKNQFARLARFNGLSQAELGAVVVIHFLSNVDLYVAILNEYKRIHPRYRTEAFEAAAEVVRADQWTAAQFEVPSKEGKRDE